MKKLNILLFALLLIFASCSQEDNNIKVKEFNIIVDETLIDSIYQDYQKDIYIPIQFVSNGDTCSAKMRLRGDSSRKYGKKSLKIVFPKKHTPKGEHRKINLNSEWTDKSYIRQYMSATLLKESGIPTFDVDFVALSVNGTFWGLYLQVQNMDKIFLKDNDLDPKGNMYKATKDGACLSHFDDIKVKWEKKSNKKANWDDLQTLINQLDTIDIAHYKSFLKQHFEYDKLTTLVAMNMLIQNGSTYYHNYYMYHDINGNNKWQIFPWDMDKSMSYYNWKPYLYHETSSNWESDNPLIEKCFLSPQVRSDIRQKVEALSQDIFNPQFVAPMIDGLEEALEPYVEQDETDQIAKLSKWKRNLDSERDFVKEQTQNILYQIDSLPKPFLLERVKTPHYKKITLHWSSSKSDKAITYTLLYGKHFLLEDSTTQKIEGISDTLVTLDNLSAGQYYWRVYATDGKNKVAGFNTKNTFTITDACQSLVKRGKHTTVDAEKPYILKSDFVLKQGERLSFQPGAVLYIAPKVQMMNQGGTLLFEGEKHHKIKVYPTDLTYEDFKLKEQSKNVFRYVEFINGSFNIQKSEADFNHTDILIKDVTGTWNPCVFGIDSKVSFYHSKLINYNHVRNEGLTLINGTGNVSHSYFFNFPDVVELTRTHHSSITDNTIVNASDDAIDINACDDIIIKNNHISKVKDSGISVGNDHHFETTYGALFGESKNIEIYHNRICKAKIGVKIKGATKDVLVKKNYIELTKKPFKTDTLAQIKFKSNTVIPDTIKTKQP